jgi:hypothetical protein
MTSLMYKPTTVHCLDNSSLMEASHTDMIVNSPFILLPFRHSLSYIIYAN